VVMLRFPKGIGFLLESIPGWFRKASSKKDNEPYGNTSS